MSPRGSGLSNGKKSGRQFMAMESLQEQQAPHLPTGSLGGERTGVSWGGRGNLSRRECLQELDFNCTFFFVPILISSL